MIMSLLTLLLLLLFATITITATASSPDVKPGCQQMCGNLRVPYPFGIGKQECALNPSFLLNCSSDQPWLGFNMPARSISVLDGTVTIGTNVAYDCYDANGKTVYSSGPGWTLVIPAPFTFSDTRNKFILISCNSLGWVTDPAYTAGTSCLTLCTRPVNLSSENCDGSGCCQTSIPPGQNILSYSFRNPNNQPSVWDLSRCKYAFVAEPRSINYSYWQLSPLPTVEKNPDTVVDWVVEKKTCQQAKADATAYACAASNSNCTDNDQGYRCLCSEGFQGNPYLPEGCVDINECLDPQKYPCEGRCKNTIGGYDCRCRFGMHGDGKTGGCHLSRSSIIIAAVGAVVGFVTIGLLLYIILSKKLEYRYFLENGGKVLEAQGIKTFKAKELAKATNNYAEKLGEGGFGAVYKGVLPDKTEVAVKKSKAIDKAKIDENIQREITAVSRANHKNVVKLVGLCLRTKVPLLVYEFIPNESLFKHIHDKNSQVLDSWGTRLRIAAESAVALSYLHHFANPPVIHGDVKPANILLDNDYTAKVADFGASAFISRGQAKDKKVQGTPGYLDPDYIGTGELTEKSDVYSFGVVLLELLTGKQPYFESKSGEKLSNIELFSLALEKNELFEILDFEHSTGADERHEIEAVAKLAKRCVNRISIHRPTMKEVSEELAKMHEHHQTDNLHGK